jgi:molybdate transport system regulatory protein
LGDLLDVETADMRKSSPTLSLRVDFDNGRLGPGKVRLLENINSCGSISAASRAMNVAWRLVDEMNRICGQPVVETHEGGKRGGGAKLTPFGMSLVAHYRNIERSVKSATRQELIALRADMAAAWLRIARW